MDIATLAGMDDAGLMKTLKLTEKLAEAKEGIAKMNELQGAARAEAEKRVGKMFTPNVYPDEFKWIAEDAERSACRDAKAELCDCSPRSIY